MAGFDQSRVEHLLEALRPERRTRVVDIGANPLDDPPYGALLRIGGCELWGFEPQKPAFDRLVATAGETEHYVNAAVGQGGKATLSVCATDGFTSLLEPNPEFTPFTRHFERDLNVVERIEIETERLDGIDMPQPDLIKIDIQGGERDVFRHGKRVLGGALTVITEVAAVPVYRDQPLLDEQMAELRKTGYHLHKFLFFKQLKLRSPLGRTMHGPAARSQLLDGDAVFVRDLMGFREMKSEALKHLAILADAVFASYDLAAAAVDALAARGEIAAVAAQRYGALLAQQVGKGRI
ncbi:FkbM family methyltransferase [Marimonas arenosa]|uniref:FkbM family methyltransferase n=1 Tax=Marimonas arenosa TaxID=1795305 RepID=A0AAE4B2V2_9RHOB|nr:FkbM family methyltransferase [Marimonas arenosa]MDQ2088657.1 FkbM family methyltransferase [Marimonas arenosa]